MCLHFRPRAHRVARTTATLGLAFALFVAGGCHTLTIHYAPELARSQDVRPESGYVFGRFYLDRSAPVWLSLGLENLTTHEHLYVELVDDGYSVRAVELPIGSYRISECVMRSTHATRGVLPQAYRRRPFPYVGPGQPRRNSSAGVDESNPLTFTVARGELVYIGDFHGTTRAANDGWVGGVDAFEWHPVETTQQLFQNFDFLRARSVRPAFRVEAEAP